MDMKRPPSKRPPRRSVLVLEDMGSHLHGMLPALGRHRVVVARHQAQFDALLAERISLLRRRLLAIDRMLKTRNLRKERTLRLRRQRREIVHSIRNRPFDAVVVDLEVPRDGVARRKHEEALENMQEIGRKSFPSAKEKEIWQFWLEEAKSHLGPHGLRVAERMQGQYQRMPVIIHSEMTSISQADQERLKRRARKSPRLRLILSKSPSTNYRELTKAVAELVETAFHRKRRGTSKRQP